MLNRCDGTWVKESLYTMSCNSRDVKHDLKDDLKEICVVGFEPNPHHTAGLLEIQEEYTKCGWSLRYKGFTQLGMREVNLTLVL